MIECKYDNPQMHVLVEEETLYCFQDNLCIKTKAICYEVWERNAHSHLHAGTVGEIENDYGACSQIQN